jgi:hypothetical protein
MRTNVLSTLVLAAVAAAMVGCGAQSPDAAATPHEAVGVTGGSAGSGATNGAGGSSGTASGSGGADAGATGAAVVFCNPAPPCPAGWVLYTDQSCGPFDLTNCFHQGDGLCYQPCSGNADCTDPRFPVCGTLSFFRGADVPTASATFCMSGATPQACSLSNDAGCGVYPDGDRARFRALAAGQRYDLGTCAYCACDSSGVPTCSLECPPEGGSAGAGDARVGG